ncbi:phosphoribosyltransferase [Prauserella flavalba]|uniref:Phosphoribosyl transferase n=1 Tax=Prauserella flavalba TaxID=1477506 RepID=A0A318LQ35_9PSEU|nr:phosphoribosyltransferase [Prauserella flavalba]PXY36511.1 phosphoribosyl transferase [Prauserella flavalba]
MLFRDRADAGRRLADRLMPLRGEDIVVLGLPRGGVPVAFEVARALAAPLDVIMVRKLGVPFQPELAMGAVGEDGVEVLDSDTMHLCGVTPDEAEHIAAAERAELAVSASRLRTVRPRVRLEGRIAVVVDDGVATGSTASAACQVARAHGARHVVLAVPVASAGALARLREAADTVLCLETPRDFRAVGQWYRDFGQTGDDEVLDLLRLASAADPAPDLAAPADPPLRDEEVTVPIGGRRLSGRLVVPERTSGLVVFAHGSGSGRHSPRNRVVARRLNDAGLGTLLFDLLTEREETDRGLVFDVGLLAARLAEAAAWLRAQPGCATPGLGYFGASTGAAAALGAAAADDGVGVGAVVSRGGRPDLAAALLPAVRAPTLLVVGSRDNTVLELNRRARKLLRCHSELAVVPGATHLFREPGTLEEAARLARDWFLRYLTESEHAGSVSRA